MSKSLLSIYPLTKVTKPTIPGYFVASTAPINVEGDNQPKHSKAVPSEQLSADQQEKSLNQIADLLFHKINNPDQQGTNCLELVISINGFSNSVQATKARVEEINHYINNDSSQQMQNKADNLMYIGYRWPSEPLVGDNSWWLEKVYNALTVLPLLPRSILFFGIISIALSMIFDWQFFVTNTFLSFLFSLLVIILTTIFFFVVSLVILRLSIYFRDYYRATNYGVPDLVELVRQLDKALVNYVKEQHLDKVSLVHKLKILVLERIRAKLSLEGKIATKQEEAILEIACDKIVNDYFLNQEINSINIEDLSSYINDDTTCNQEYLDHIVNLGREIINRTTDEEFVKIKERAISILENKAKKYWQEHNRIKLTFIGHSMGAYVVTNAVRILSDVFDLNSVGTLGLTNKTPTSDIGRVFALERLVLVAPDIPITTILSGRANFLRSSLRRFREAYLFSNEGDLALRIASTVANYISFPARTRESGYRLGNVAIKDSEGYGIINLNHILQHQELLRTLFVDSFNTKKSLANIQEGFHFEEVFECEEIASLFTYFDCTDYTDRTTKFNSKKHRILTIAKWRWEPRWLYYIRLSIAYGLGIRDTHGGYFQGQFSQQAIYRLAFLGFGGYLDSLNQKDRISALDYLSQQCSQKKIQIILSPERYEVDILGRGRQRVRKEMLNV